MLAPLKTRGGKLLFKNSCEIADRNPTQNRLTYQPITALRLRTARIAQLGAALPEAKGAKRSDREYSL